MTISDGAIGPEVERDASRFPRVLIVNGEPFTTRTATGLTLQSLFRGWPAERLACLYISEADPTPGACAQYHRLTSAQLPLAVAIHRILGKPLPPARSMSRPPSSAPRGTHWTDRSPAFRALRTFAANQYLLQLGRYRLPEEVLGALDSFRPELMYTMLGANSVLALAADLHARYRVPIVPHIMDDWPTTLYKRSIFRPVLRTRMKRTFHRVLERAPLRLVIGADMAEEYGRRYGGRFEAFMNAVEPEWLAEAPQPRAGRVRVMYVGGLHLNRWRSLKLVGEALTRLRADGIDAELVVHTQPRFAEEAKRIDIAGVVRLMGPLAASEVPAALRSAHVLLHVESFDRRSRAYARYSVSTKIPECMGAARPILAFGPADLASMRYVKRCGAGICVERQRVEDLVEALRRLVCSEPLRVALGSRGLLAARASHDALLQRQRFRSLLSAVARAEAT